MPENPINTNIAVAASGLNLDSALSQLKEGQLTFAMNAVLNSVSGDMVSYSNESGNTPVTPFPQGYFVIGKFAIPERDLDIFFLTSDGGDQIGYLLDGVYSPKVLSNCTNFSTDHPIHKIVYKSSTCGLELYWTDAFNHRRWLNWDNPPYTSPGGLEVDCNKLLVQPDFSIPSLESKSVESGGTTLSGTYQFAIQYANALGEGYTSYYSVTNPVPLYNEYYTGTDFNYPVNKSIQLSVSHIDTTGFFSYFNIAVIRTVNDIPTFELIGTYDITGPAHIITYSGQSLYALDEKEVFIKYPIFSTAQDVTTIQDIIVWTGLTEPDRISYQKIWNDVHLQWVAYKVPKETYKDPIKSAKYKMYLGDESYAFEGVFLLNNGKQTDRCHIPGRPALPFDLEPVHNDDVPNIGDKCDTSVDPLPHWKVYNTAIVSHITTNDTAADCYEGEYHWGEFAYTQSEELYPDREDIWGELAGTPIRHHKFPDATIHQIHQGESVYPLGVRIDIQTLRDAIERSSLTQEQKKEIQGIKIVRANRRTQETVVAKGIINNVLKYTTDGKIIEGNNDQGGGASGSLIDAASSNIQQAITSLPFLSPDASDFQRQERLNAITFYQKAQADLNAAGNIPTGSAEYKAKINEAIDATKEGQSWAYGNSIQFADAAIQVMQDLLTIEPIDSISNPTIPLENTNTFLFPNYLYNDVSGKDPFLDFVQVDEESKSRFVIYSPDLLFAKPSLGDTLKLETIEEGISYSKIAQVKNHSRYQFVNDTAYITALIAGSVIGFASGTYGLSNNVFNGTAAFTAYQAMLDIIFKVTPRKNFCYQVNSIGEYSTHIPVPNSGNKQRSLSLSSYLSPGVHSVGDKYTVNNWQRESSVYLSTDKSLPYSHEQGGQEDKSKVLYPTLGITPSPISTYYASVKRSLPSQYGQMYSYESVDTGFQYFFSDIVNDIPTDTVKDFFGGDSYITPFSLKIKIPFFIDNRIGQNGQAFIDDADISYNELSNIGKVKYWFSTDASSAHGLMSAVFGVKDHHFYWERDTTFSDNGMIFLFAYAIPTFWVESTVNTYLRQATNGKEGDFYPHVGTGIPEDWLQETHTTIAQDNTYTYNSTFSKQNKENYFSFLPLDWQFCQSLHPYKGIYSDPQGEDTSFNHWLIYRPNSTFTLPNTYGKLTSMEGIENRMVLARMENATLLYNSMQTIPTSSGQAYLGTPLFSAQQPPIDYLWSGSQHHLFIRTPYGSISVDSRRKKVFLLTPEPKDITGNLTTFFNQQLPFHISKKFPDIDIDNHFKGIGLHGCYDSENKRVLITKLDYECTDKTVILRENKFYKSGQEVLLSDTRYFSNRCWTLSYTFEVGEMPVMNWTSFHSYNPRFYHARDGYYYTSPGDALWLHDHSPTLLNNFYGDIHPYTIEYPFSYKLKDEILQSVKDYVEIRQYFNPDEYVQTDDKYYSSCVLYSNDQCSGILKLAPKPQRSLSAYGQYPIYNDNSKTITFTKSEYCYNINTFWDLVKDKKKSVWKQSLISPHKELNQDIMSYSKRSYSKAPLRTRDLKCRFILDDNSSLKFISTVLLTSTQTSLK